MTLAIMQPYFFPYLGYFQLIQAADHFILLDDVQYIRHGWINRNRILKPASGHQYITATLAKHKRATLIKDICDTNGLVWKEKVLRQLEHYKKRAPYYPAVCNLLRQCFVDADPNIARQNRNYLMAVLQYLGMQNKLSLSSQMNLDYTEVKEAGDWALCMAKQTGASTYINPMGGKPLFCKKKFTDNNIQLGFLNPVIKEYNQYRDCFEPCLSIIDVMMFNAPDDIKAMLNDYTISWQ
jgi:hypothetical protein